MIRALICLGVILLLFVSCKEVKVKPKMDASIFDTIYFETEKKVDTILLKTTKQSEGIWVNKMLYKKENNGKFFIIASSLSDNDKIIAIDNLKDTLNTKILGTDVSYEVKKFKKYDLLIASDSTYNSGSLYKTVNTYLLDDKVNLIKNEEFNALSKDKGKTYDKELEIISVKDSVYFGSK